MQFESISSKFVGAVSWTTLASLVGRASGLVNSVLIARFLGSSALGIYTIVLSILGLFATFLNFGLGLTGSKVVAQYYTNDPKKTGRVISLLFLTSIVTILLGVIMYWLLLPYVANHVYKIPELLPVLKLSLLWLVVICINQLLESVLIGMQGFKSLMLVNSLLSFLNLFLILLAFYLGKPNILSALVMAGTLTAVIQMLFLSRILYFEFKQYQIELSFQQLRPLIHPILFKFSIPAFIGKIMEQPLSWLSILILVKLCGELSCVGGLAVITNVRTWLLYLPTMLVSVLVPLFTDIYHTRDLKDFRRTLIFSQRFLWLTTLPFLTFSIVVIRQIIELFFGKLYTMFWFSGAIFLTSTILISINEVNDKAMIAMDKMWLSLSFRIVYFILLIISLLAFVPTYHLEGYVFGYSLSYLIYVLIQLIWFRQVTQEKLSSILNCAIFSAIVLGIAFFIAYFGSMIIMVICALLLFCAVVVIEWFYLIRNEEKILLFSILKKIFKRKILD